MKLPPTTLYYHSKALTYLTCPKHGRKYQKCCIECEHEKTLADFKEIIKVRSRLREQVQRLSRRVSTKTATIQRAWLVKVLHDDYGFSFYRLGKMLKRYHTTIMYLYKYATKELT